MYEYATEHDIKCLVVITDSQKVQSRFDLNHRSLVGFKLKFENVLVIHRGCDAGLASLVKFLSEAMQTQFRNPSVRDLTWKFYIQFKLMVIFFFERDESIFLVS